MKILITGARGGMGRDAAFALARLGHQVLATTRTEEQAQQLAKEIREADLKNISASKLDITEPADRQSAVASGAPDALINNAAIGESGPLAEIPMELVRKNFETNVFGTLALTQLVAQGMKSRGSGRIITFSSVGGVITLPYLGAYSMTKYALESMSEALRQELSHHGIWVSLIEPGAIATGFNERMIATKRRWFGSGSLFGDDAERVAKFENMLVKDQHDTESITAAVIHAATAPKPKTRYMKPNGTAFLVKMSLRLPDHWRDATMRLMSGVKD